jgi:hypothetical protein
MEKIEPTVHCATQQEYDALMEWAAENGYLWNGDDNSRYQNFYNRYAPYTAVHMRKQGMMYGTVAFYTEDRNYPNPISFEQFAEEQGLYNKLPEDYF